MQILSVLIALAPKIIEVARLGQAAWADFMDTLKIQGDDALNAKLDELKSDFVRIRLIAEAEANN